MTEPSFRFVNADWNFWPDGLDRADIWHTCARLGFDAMELGVYRADDELSGEALSAIGRLAAETGLGLEAVLFSMPPARWPDGGLATRVGAKEAVAEIVETARRAADAGARVLGLWPGADPPAGADDADADGWARTIEALHVVADAAGPLGLALAVEYKPGQLVAGVADALRLVESLDRPAVGVLVDTAHAFAGGEDVADLPAQLGDRLVHVHLGDAAEGDPDADLPPGSRHDFVPFLAALDRAGCGAALSFDLYGAVEAGVASGTEASEHSLRYIRDAVARAAG